MIHCIEERFRGFFFMSRVKMGGWDGSIYRPVFSHQIYIQSSVKII